MLVAIHPRFLNPILQRLGKAKARSQGLTVITSTLRLKAYPWRSLLGELGFVALRGLGFMMTIIALQALQPSQFFPIMGAFSIAWLMGLVVPGAPGGVGVFEAVAIAILGNQLPSGLLISAVALYRLISTLAEALGAGLIWLEERIAALMAPIDKVKRRLLLLPSAQDEEPSSDDQAADLLDNVPEEAPALSYVVSSREPSLSETNASSEATVSEKLDSNSSNGASVAEAAVSVELDKAAPSLPSFVSKPTKGDR
jgi:hypothetical protein